MTKRGRARAQGEDREVGKADEGPEADLARFVSPLDFAHVRRNLEFIFFLAKASEKASDSSTSVKSCGVGLRNQRAKEQVEARQLELISFEQDISLYSNLPAYNFA